MLLPKHRNYSGILEELFKYIIAVAFIAFMIVFMQFANISTDRMLRGGERMMSWLDKRLNSSSDSK
jgi:hypothetical protein